MIMARISYTVYKTSALATVLSFLSSIAIMGGCGFAAAGILSKDYSMLPAGLIFFAAGVGAKFLAEMLAANGWWKKVVMAQNLEPQIRESVDFCFKVYNTNPCNLVLNKIEALNPQGAAQIRSAICAQKK